MSVRYTVMSVGCVVVGAVSIVVAVLSLLGWILAKKKKKSGIYGRGHRRSIARILPFPPFSLRSHTRCSAIDHADIVHQRDDSWLSGNASSRGSISAAFKLSLAEPLLVAEISRFSTKWTRNRARFAPPRQGSHQFQARMHYKRGCEERARM